MMPARRHHDDAWYRRRLAPPVGRPRIVIDTDAANEIDDQFALAWALLSLDRLELEAVYAAPYSFEHRRQEMLRARRAGEDPANASAADLTLLQQHAPRLRDFERRGLDVATLDWPVFDAPDIGMERSHQEILNVFDKLSLPTEGRVFRGSAGYLRRVVFLRPVVSMRRSVTRFPSTSHCSCSPRLDWRA